VDVTLRRALIEDATELAELHLLVWRQAYADLIPEQVFAEREAVPLEQRAGRWADFIEHTQTLVGERPTAAGTEIVGWAQCGPSRDTDGPELQLYSIYLRADQWSTGLGSRLLVGSLRAEPASVWVLDGNTRAEAFYRRHGFEYDGLDEVDQYGLLDRRMVR
jgi:GNAT superfamily N-acetyltransferase